MFQETLTLKAFGALKATNVRKQILMNS